MFGSNSKLTNILKEKDYDFLLIAKYGRRWSKYSRGN